MEILNTKNIIEWLDALNSEHSLTLDILEYTKNNFYSKIDILTNIVDLDVQFAEVHASGYKGKFVPNKSKAHNEAFLFTHSFNYFEGSQNGNNIKGSGMTFALDLSKDFHGCYVNHGHSKSIVIPFDIISSSVVDFLRGSKFENHPFFLSIDTILKSISGNESDIDNQHKIKAIVELLSIGNIEEKHTLVDDIKFFVDKCIVSNHRLSLDILAENFFMSRRKMQYVLASQDLTYRKLIEESKTRYHHRSLLK